MEQLQTDRLRADAWERYRDIRLRALADTPDAFASTIKQEAAFPPDRWRARLSRPSATLIAARGMQDVGMAVGAPWQDRPGFAGLFGMWVAPDARGRGVGGRLVQEVVAWARASAFVYLALDVADDNLAAIRFYERCGVTPTGVTGSLPPPRDTITEHERSLAL